MKVKLTLEYDGSAFCGWQSQPKQRSVQDELRRALEVYFVSEAKRSGVELPEIPVVTGSGRTDAGVHARGQVASFSWPEGFSFDGGTLCLSLNGITARELTVVSACEVDDSFDARYSPHQKRYSYQLCFRRGDAVLRRAQVWQIYTELRVAEMIKAARLFRGTRDFSAFRASDCGADTAVRTVNVSELTRVSASEFVYVIEGNGFLKQMVRAIVGTLVDVGRGRIEVAEISAIIESKDRTKAGETAPACGLVLEEVRYS